MISPNVGRLRFDSYAQDWLAARTHLRPKTVELYDYLLRLHLSPTFGHVSINKITVAMVRDWNAKLRSGPLSETTAAKAYRLLRQIIESSVDDRLIRENPCRVKGAATERTREREIPSLDEVVRLAEAIEPRYRAMVLLAATVGLRKGECFGLARRHLALEQEPFTVTVERGRLETVKHGMIFQEPKTLAGYRMVAIPPSLVPELQQHLDLFADRGPDSLLFTDERTGDTPIKTYWRTAWDKARNGAEVDCTFHDLRHVARTLNAAAGATIKEAMARLGHNSPEAALRYQHASKARDHQIAADIDRLLRGA